MGGKEEEEKITPGCWTGIFVKHTCAAMWGFFFLVIAITAVTVLNGVPVPSMVSGWEDKNAVPNQRLAAATLVRESRFTLDSLSSGRRRSLAELEAEAHEKRRALSHQGKGAGVAADNEAAQERSYVLDSVSVLYDGLGGNMLAADRVAAAITFEGALLDDPVWPTACKLTYSAFTPGESNCSSGTSILNYIHTNAAAHQKQCEVGYCMMPTAMLGTCGTAINWGEGLCRSAVYNWKRDGVLAPEATWGTLISSALCGTDPISVLINKAMLPVDHTCSPPNALYLLANYELGWPLVGFNTTNQFVAQFTELQNGASKALTTSLNAAQNLVSATPANSRYYVGTPSGGKLVSIMWSANTSAGWRAILMADGFLALASMAFIFFFIWFHTGSIVLTLVGMFEIIMSLPLALFFYSVIGGQQNLSFMAVVSIYLILCIGADDIFVMTDCWKATKFMPPHISGSLETRFVVAYRQASSAMFSTTSTTVICLVCAAFMPIPQLSSFAIFASLAVTLDYLLVITWFPAALLAYEKYCGGECCCIKCEQAVCCAPKIDPKMEGGPPPRRMVRLMRDKWAPTLYKLRWVSLGVMFLLSAGSIGACVALARPGKDLVFMESFTPLVTREDILSHKFYVQNDFKITISTFYGLDRSKPALHAPTNQLIPADTGTWGVNTNSVDLVYDTAFALGPSMQTHIVADCDNAIADAGLVNSGEAFCVLNDLKAWDPTSFPYPTEAALYAALVSFYGSAAYDALTDTYTGYSYQTGFIYDDAAGEITALWNTFNSTIPPNIDPDPLQLQPWYDKWENYVAGSSLSASGGGGAPFHSTPLWFMFNMLSTLLINALVTCGIAVGASFFVLLAVTLNWYLALLATICILLVMAGVIGIVMLMGSALGMYECMVIILSIGLAVDYDVHLTHFYNEAKGTRKEKAIAALSSVGISIIGGAGTTMGAGLPLFFTAMTFFKLCGWFIFFTSLCSIVQSFFLLMPMLMVLGPEGTQGDLGWICGKKHPAAKAAEATVTTTASNIAPAVA